ncbi:RDD family protein [Brevibacillus composti]|uniref:RDD family protein n=1 Tax=Brevibacillus composti TaxID=2796470 RepID=A0A7T5ENT7_9BACL|nr:RDD family protein [Brevibacillus composti]QQE76011.1 RDD family protein [Brevibacillus composti]QUO43037.1 RDD family protein [Brevibacillus composti]
METAKPALSNPVGFWRRLGGSLLDGLIIGVPLVLISWLITGSLEDNFVANMLSTLYYVLVPVFWAGYTVGKKIVGIRIVKVDGSQVGIGTMLLRTIVGMGLVYGLTFGIGAIVSAIMVGVREDKRSIHDLIAGTYVTSDTP